MGEDSLKGAGISPVTAFQAAGGRTTSEDTVECVRQLNRCGLDILVFFGGDGTAADVSSAILPDLPVIGIPAGVKMHSPVFAQSLEHARRMFKEWLSDGFEYRRLDVVDAEEKAMMEGKQLLEVKGALLVPASSHMMIEAKREYESTDIMGAVEYIIEKMEPGTSYIISTGSTCKAIVSELGFETPYYGVDVVRDRELIRENADSGFLSEYSAANRCILVLTPIGGQGFIIGRGNRQIDDSVLKNIKQEDIIVVSSVEKLLDLEFLAIDSGVWGNDYIRVLYDYGRFRLMRVSH